MATGIHASPAPAKKHGNLRRKFQREDPRRLDAISRETAAALQQAVPSLKVGGACAGITGKGFSHWWNNGTGPVLDASLFVFALARTSKGNAGALVVHFGSTLRRALMSIAAPDLIQRYHRYMREESERDGWTDTAQATVGHTRDLRGLRDHVRAHAAALVELDALLGEIIDRGIDPYQQEVV